LLAKRFEEDEVRNGSAGVVVDGVVPVVFVLAVVIVEVEDDDDMRKSWRALDDDSDICFNCERMASTSYIFELARRFNKSAEDEEEFVATEVLD
jgi:hypothetical protein